MASTLEKQTDADGNADMSLSTLSEGDYNLRVYDKFIPECVANLNVEVIDVSNIELSLSEDMVSPGNGVIVTAIPVKDGIPIDGILIHVNGEDLVTDSEGKAEYYYDGNGAGRISLSANCGNTSNSIQVDDVLRYWSTEKRGNWYYSSQGALTVDEMYQGLRLKAPYERNGQMYFGYSNSVNEDWEFSFVVKSAKIIDTWQVCGNTMGSYLKANSRYRIVKNGKSVSFYVNDVEVATTSYTVNFTPYLVMNGEIILDKIKIVRL